MNNEIKVWVATYVDYGDMCDGKARVLGVRATKEAAAALVRGDMTDWLEEHKDEGAEIDIGRMRATFDYDTSDGCEWNVEEVSLDVRGLAFP